VKPYKNEEGIILLAEDRDADAELLKHAFLQAGITNPIVVVPDGDEAIRYLEGLGPYKDSPLPILLLLDLKMPNSNGFEVLRWIRGHPMLKPLRVLVLTVSESIYDVRRAYELGANSFMIKTQSKADLIAQAKEIKSHWIDAPAPPLVRLQVIEKAG
jgi:CheY-like chemotaxis protein